MWISNFYELFELLSSFLRTSQLWIKLTRVGFQAQVKIASRIIFSRIVHVHTAVKTSRVVSTDTQWAGRLPDDQHHHIADFIRVSVFFGAVGHRPYSNNEWMNDIT